VRTELPSGTVTFLFTDVEGSTRLLHELGADAYAEALAEHRRVIREACRCRGRCRGRTQGDAFFFAFPTAPRALAAAEAMTERLAAGPIHVRIGLHTGTPLLAEEGYRGADVHRAARIAAVGHGGQVILSRSTAELVEVSLTELGEHRLKDISERHRHWRSWPPSLPGHGEPERAGRGALETVEQAGALGQRPRLAPWAQDRERFEAVVFAEAGPDFERSRSTGRRLTLDRAVEEALAAA
jgi:class 3 adenylate cyclase